MSYSSYCKRNKIKLALSPYRKQGNWHSWRGYQRGSKDRKYFYHPDTREGYDKALLEFANWLEESKERRPWVVELKHHKRQFELVEKWYAMHGIPEGEKAAASFVPKLLDAIQAELDVETPRCPHLFVQGSTSNNGRQDRMANQFILEFCHFGFVEELRYLEMDEAVKSFQRGFGSKFYTFPDKWVDRLRKLNATPKTNDKPQLVEYWHEKYLEHKSKQVKRGQRSPATLRDVRQKTNAFVNFLGQGRIVSELSEDDWTDFYDWIAETKESSRGESRQSYLNSTRTFFRWCRRQKACHIKVPDNFDDPDISFVYDDDSESTGSRLSELWTVDEIKTVLDSTEDHWKAFVLLSLNCGFLASDLNALTHEKYQGKRIIHKRRKSRRKKYMPTVNYLLWDATVEAIERVKTDEAVFAELLHTKGGVTILTPKSDGSGEEWNNISRNWQAVRERLGLRKKLTLRKLRNTANTELKKSDKYRDLDQLWLGHAQTLADKRYHIIDGQVYKPLDKAIRYIGKQLKIE
tara:strand:+ start:1504 stop:3063 length:1560 start_codon:yes stop_codon:yes gene_type:complete